MLVRPAPKERSPKIFNFSNASPIRKIKKYHQYKERIKVTLPAIQEFKVILQGSKQKTYDNADKLKQPFAHQQETVSETVEKPKRIFVYKKETASETETVEESKNL